MLFDKDRTNVRATIIRVLCPFNCDAAAKCGHGAGAPIVDIARQTGVEYLDGQGIETSNIEVAGRLEEILSAGMADSEART